MWWDETPILDALKKSLANANQMCDTETDPVVGDLSVPPKVPHTPPSFGGVGTLRGTLSVLEGENK